MGEEAFAALKPKFTKLDVKVGRDVVFQDTDCSRLVFKMLKDRLQESPDDDNFQFSPRVQAIL